MLETRRRLLSIFTVAAGFAALDQLAPYLSAQSTQPHPLPQPRPSPNAPANPNAPTGLDGGPTKNTPRQGELNRQLSATIKEEVDKLCAMANELKQDMLGANPSETLSLSFVKKAQAIEKLAKQIKEQAKG
jgi:hypothetical protein